MKTKMQARCIVLDQSHHTAEIRWKNEVLPICKIEIKFLGGISQILSFHPAKFS